MTWYFSEIGGRIREGEGLEKESWTVCRRKRGSSRNKRETKTYREGGEKEGNV